MILRFIFPVTGQKSASNSELEKKIILPPPASGFEFDLKKNLYRL